MTVFSVVFSSSLVVGAAFVVAAVLVLSPLFEGLRSGLSQFFFSSTLHMQESQELGFV